MTILSSTYVLKLFYVFIEIIVQITDGTITNLLELFLIKSVLLIPTIRWFLRLFVCNLWKIDYGL